MFSKNKVRFLKQGLSLFLQLQNFNFRRLHKIPFVDFYEKTTGEAVSQYFVDNVKKRYPGIESLNEERLECTLQILNKFNICAGEACMDMHVFIMNPITMDNYGEILKECCFIKIIPKHIIRYHSLVRNRTIAHLKDRGLLREDLNLEEVLLSHLQDWPDSAKQLEQFRDGSTSILKVRMSVLQKYLSWRLSVTPEEFDKYCRNYLPLKHKPMSDIQEALDIAQNEIKFDKEGIRKNGFVISSDPINTKLIIENVKTIAGFDIRDAIKIEPAMLKNNYSALLEIRSILEEFRIPLEAQRRCLKIYCMCPRTVRQRLEEMTNLKEYQVLKSNPRILSMVVHKKKMMERLGKMYEAKKQCYSLNHLISSAKVFNNYIHSFGNKVCGRDLTTLISSSLQVNTESQKEADSKRLILEKLKRHKYYLHAALNGIHENIQYLKTYFDDSVIVNNCQILLYPLEEIKLYIDFIIEMRSGKVKIHNSPVQFDSNYNNLNHKALNDDQVLSIVLYEIEKKYHFSGDGMWSRQENFKMESANSPKPLIRKSDITYNYAHTRTERMNSSTNVSETSVSSSINSPP